MPIEGAFYTMASFKECHTYLLSDEVGYLPYLKQNLISYPDKETGYGIIEVFCRRLENHNIQKFFDVGIVELIFKNYLQFNKDKVYEIKDPESEISGCWAVCMSIIAKLSKSPVVSKYFLENIPNGPVEFIQTIQPDDPENKEGFYLGKLLCIISMCNIYGKEENTMKKNNSEVKQILDLYPDTIDVIAAILEMTIDKQPPALLELFGLFTVEEMATALKNLSISDKNKKLLTTHQKLLKYVGKAIQLFIDNAPPCSYGVDGSEELYGLLLYADGGGKDLGAIERLLEFLFQLSFYYESDEALKESFKLPEHDLVGQLTAIVTLPPERQLTYEAKRSATSLLTRFQIRAATCNDQLFLGRKERSCSCFEQQSTRKVQLRYLER